MKPWSFNNVKHGTRWGLRRCPRGTFLNKAGFLLGVALLFSAIAAGQEPVQNDQSPPPACSYDPKTGECLPPQTTTQTPGQAPANRGQGVAPTTPTTVTNPNQPQEKLQTQTELNPSESTKPKKVELTDFQKLVATSLGQVLPIYGQALFQNVPTTFAPVDHVPVTADYVVGPGDELLIRAWGQIDFDIRARVDRNGAIYIPKVGELNVAGLQYQQLQSFLKSHIGRIYQNFDLNVSMGDLRSIDIYVVGQAARPGRYTVSSLSTLANAVFACGGPSSSGSMRHIELKRNGKVATDFDLYDLLVKGDKSKDVMLMPEDVIYFAPIGPVIAMAGQVNNPAIYEMRGEMILRQALQLAGGLTTTALGSKVYVEEIKGHEDRTITEVKLDDAGLGYMLKDGDVFNFTAISPRFVDAVTLRGNVAAPGRYPWHEGMRVTDLIPNREFLITREYWKQQNAINLERQSGDNTKAVLNDVVRNAPEINWEYAVVQRISRQDLSTELVPFNLGKAVLQHDEASNLPLQPGDVVTIFSQADLRVPREQQTKIVRLEGEFASAGIYRAQPGETLRELVAQSGGLASSAYLYGSVFTRASTRAQQQERLDLVIAQMERDLAQEAARRQARGAETPEEVEAARRTAEAQQASLQKLRQMKADGRVVLNFHPNDSGLDAIPPIPLEDGDEFVVPSRPLVVNVFGDVYNQGSFIQREGKTVTRYLRDAGGPTRNADKGKIFVLRANGAVVSKDAATGFWSGGFSSMVLMPGDTLVVPEQLNPGAAWRNVKDISRILFDFGLAAAAVKVLKQ